MQSRTKTKLLWIVFFLSILIMVFVPPVSQPQSYHLFADSRDLFDIRNYLNVISNVPFMLAGIYGLIILFSASYKKTTSFKEQKPYIVFFISSILVGLGSSYYHLNPNNMTLLWDRLPMSIMIMAIFCAICCERVSPKLGNHLLLPLILIGIASVIYWEYSEMIGQGDLRFYVWAQVFPILMILLIIIFYPSKYTHANLIIIALISYTIAKGSEFFDKGIYMMSSHFISGHTIKHLAAALGVYSIANYLKYKKLKKEK